MFIKNLLWFESWNGSICPNKTNPHKNIPLSIRTHLKDPRTKRHVWKPLHTFKRLSIQLLLPPKAFSLHGLCSEGICNLQHCNYCLKLGCNNTHGYATHQHLWWRVAKSLQINHHAACMLRSCQQQATKKSVHPRVSRLHLWHASLSSNSNAWKHQWKSETSSEIACWWDWRTSNHLDGCITRRWNGLNNVPPKADIWPVGQQLNPLSQLTQGSTMD